MIHYFGGSPAEGSLAAAGFAAPFVGAGLLGLIGAHRSRVELSLATGVALVPMSLISVVLFPLLIPAGILIRRSHSVAARRLAVPALLGLALVGTLALLILHQDPASWTTPDEFGSSSNIVTTVESTLSLVITVSVVALAYACLPT